MTTRRLDQSPGPQTTRLSSTGTAAPAQEKKVAELHDSEALLQVRDGFGGATQGAQANRLAGNSATEAVVQARESAASGWVIVTSNDDDPFARSNNTEKMHKADFTLDAKGKPVGLEGPRVKIGLEDVIYRQNDKREFEPFAVQAWKPAQPNRQGNFTFRDEPRFPLHDRKVDKDGKTAVNKDGLQVWHPRELYSGQTTTFEAVNTASRSMEGWAGRKLPWGQDGQMEVNTHAFVGFNAFFSPAARGLFFGVVPYRLPGESDLRMFEMASSWEIAAHEAGHALHNELKPNRGLTDQGYRQWGESVGDQLAMWSSLQDPDRAKALLREVGGNLNKSNSITQLGEVFATLVGEGTGLRDSFHNKTVENTSDEYHDRSEVLTGAAYKVFQRVYTQMRQEGVGELEAVQQSAAVMGTFMARVADHTPENSMTFEDVAKAHLTVDKEYFGGKYGHLWTEQFTRRGMFTETSVAEHKAHLAKVPKLTLEGNTPEAVSDFLQKNLKALGVGKDFGLTLQSHHVDAEGRQVVRVELTDGRGEDAKALGNHGVMVFRQDGSLMDFQRPLPAGLTNEKAKELLTQARKAGLDTHGAPLAFAAREQGGFTVHAVAHEGGKLDGHLREYSLDAPGGKTHDYAYQHRDDHTHLQGYLPSGAQVLTAEDLARGN
jgi:hypothetical protein